VADLHRADEDAGNPHRPAIGPDGRHPARAAPPDRLGALRLPERTDQGRATLETLATIKNPPAVFAREANIAHGPQQVNNNGMMLAGEPRAGEREPEKAHNELLEEKPHERLDTGTPGSAIGSDPAMAAVGAIIRGEDDAG